jgi:hypothetical protein
MCKVKVKVKKKPQTTFTPGERGAGGRGGRYEEKETYNYCRGDELMMWKGARRWLLYFEVKAVQGIQLDWSS